MRPKPTPMSLAAAFIGSAAVARIRGEKGAHTDNFRCRSGACRVAVFLVFSVSLVAAHASSSYAATTWTVCTSVCDYTTIAAAIAAASTINGDTISILDPVQHESGIHVSKDLTIEGQGPTNTAVDGGGNDSVFIIDGFGTDQEVNAKFQDMTIRDGGNVEFGGGIAFAPFAIFSALAIDNCTITGNSASSEGGGILNFGTLTITNSTISGNSASGPTASGGGIFNAGSVSDNNSTVTIVNSTISGNSASGDSSAGGGIYNKATVTISYSTISGNSARSGGGIFNDDGIVVSKNSIVGDNLTDDDCASSGDFMALGSNLDTDSSCPGFTQVTSEQLNLGPLQLNAPGSTETQALAPPSVAIDATDDCTDADGNLVTTDQRGEPRPDPLDGPNANCDIGAYEYQDSFAGTPGKPNCHGKSVSALSNQFGTLDAAASALGYPSVKALHAAINAYCGG